MKGNRKPNRCPSPSKVAIRIHDIPNAFNLYSQIPPSSKISPQSPTSRPHQPVHAGDVNFKTALQSPPRTHKMIDTSDTISPHTLHKHTSISIVHPFKFQKELKQRHCKIKGCLRISSHPCQHRPRYNFHSHIINIIIDRPNPKLLLDASLNTEVSNHIFLRSQETGECVIFIERGAERMESDAEAMGGRNDVGVRRDGESAVAVKSGNEYGRYLVGFKGYKCWENNLPWCGDIGRERSIRIDAEFYAYRLGAGD